MVSSSSWNTYEKSSWSRLHSLGPLAGSSTAVTIWQLSKDKLTLTHFWCSALVYIVLPHQKTMANPVSRHFHHTYSLFTFSLWFHLFSPPPDHAFATLSPINPIFFTNIFTNNPIGRFPTMGGTPEPSKSCGPFSIQTNATCSPILRYTHLLITWSRLLITYNYNLLPFMKLNFHQNPNALIIGWSG